ncbi:MAG TPA: hypothetical protein DD473_22315 [Planctomycetaceae bacterium]|nr:hypothetical protein [Planctomycetaceae bacterium]
MLNRHSTPVRQDTPYWSTGLSKAKGVVYGEIATPITPFWDVPPSRATGLSFGYHHSTRRLIPDSLRCLDRNLLIHQHQLRSQYEREL